MIIVVVVVVIVLCCCSIVSNLAQGLITTMLTTTYQNELKTSLRREIILNFYIENYRFSQQPNNTEMRRKFDAIISQKYPKELDKDRKYRTPELENLVRELEEIRDQIQQEHK